MSESRTLIISDGEANTRIDVLLAHHLNIGRAAAQRLLVDGSVYINGSRVTKKGILVSAGERIEISNFANPAHQIIIPNAEMPLVELNHGPGWIAVDKSAGMPVHPLHADESQTLLSAVVARYPHIQGIGEGGLRSGVVHRLDIDTSGMILFATAENTWRYLRNAFQEHRTRKIYHAIVAGELTGADRLVLDLCIAQHSPARVKVVGEEIIPRPPGTRRCDLSYRALASSKIAATLRVADPRLVESRLLTPATLIEISLGTGFLHQIRVMLAHIGHPILGDSVYGSSTSEFPRQMLHAQSVRIGDIHAESPYPPDFSAALFSLGLHK